MIKDLKHIKHLSQIEVDICIVGGGASGITIARELIDSGLSVLLVESGSLEYEQATQDLYRAENICFKDFPLETTRLRFLGGTTNHWGGMCRPLDAFDFKRNYEGISNWPLSKKQLQPYYHRAQKVCELGEFIYDKYQEEFVFPEDFPLQDKDNKFQPIYFQRSPPTRFGITYLEQLKTASNISVLLNANVKELVENSQGTHITSASLITLSGIEAQVKAKKFILAAGGLENPRILLLSKKRNEAGIGNNHDLVGRNYMDHIGTYIGKVLFKQPIDTNTIFFQEKKIRDAQLGAFLAPSEKLVQQHGCGNFRLQFTPGTESDLSIEELKSVLKDIANLNWPDDVISKLSNIVSSADTFANLAYKNIFDTSDKIFEENYKQSGQLCNVLINMEQTPNSNSRITLSDKLDALGLPLLRFDWQLSAMETDTLNVAIREFTSMLGRSGAGRFKVSSQVNRGEPEFGISCHHSGTTRMADDPTKGVVDSNCRVHGIDNLYISGSSVFPTIGWANPTLTIVALSLRLADTIKSTLIQNSHETIKL